MSILLGLLLAMSWAAESIPTAEKELLFQRAVQAARKEGLDQQPEVKSEIDQALYRAFLRNRLAANAKELEPSPDDVKAEYEKSPLVKIRLSGETTDFRGENQMPPELYEAVKTMKPGQKGQVQFDGSKHTFRLLERKPFEGAFPTYLAYLKGKVREARERAFLLSALKDLKETP